ncbi:hypothetical protein Anapl_03515 [Anas platyrhynchos]|uniref:Uncharacterized protein n=1 Tax=Anas platyrhynchos TaxID=8839 RepID=R0K4U5_ANAPL|nr:hypothetical protein Anapl_03515 [Anas platyrhynchos]
MWLQKTRWSEEGTRGTPEKQLFLFPDSLGVSGRTPARSLLRTLVKHSQQQELQNKSLLFIYCTKAMTEQVTAVLPNWVSQDENISRGAKIFLRFSETETASLAMYHRSTQYEIYLTNQLLTEGVIVPLQKAKQGTCKKDWQETKVVRRICHTCIRVFGS